MSVPEQFDMIQTIEKFKPMIQEHINSDITNESEKKAYEAFLETSGSKIPIFIDMEDSLMCSKLMSNNMLITYEEFEEYEELEVTILARVISANLIDMKKPFYDPLKDFMKINRTLRRSMKERTDGLHEIYADQSYKMLEILAIYQ